MNTSMWNHPVTSEHLERITKWGYTVIEPISKVLMCGDKGKGAMENVPEIVTKLKLFI